MYFPYLYGRQAELRAIEKLTGVFGDRQTIFPIIEPVAESQKLKRTLEKLKGVNKIAYLVTNPNQGNFEMPDHLEQWLSDLAAELADPDLVRPVLNVHPKVTLDDVERFTHKHSGRDIGLVLTSSRIRPGDLAQVLGGSGSLSFLLPGADPATYTAELGAHRTVNVSDNFRPEARNADYRGEEWLANNHISYVAAGHPGFSDFTILPSKYNSGGGPTGAAAIHMTFKVEDDSFWIQHFVSDETDRNAGNTSSKLLEALKYLKLQVDSTPYRFEFSPALAAYLKQLESGTPTNLSKSKELQVVHHIYTVSKYLNV